MTKTDKSKIYSTVGAILFTILGLLLCYNIIRYVSRSGDFDDAIYPVFECAVLIGFGITLFLREKKGVLIASAVKAALILYVLFYIFDIYSVFYFAVYVGLVCVSAFALQRNNIVRKIWFIPMALLCVRFIWVSVVYHFLGFVYLIEVAGVLFIGLWLREDVISPVAEKELKANNVYNVFNKNNIREDTGNLGSLIGGADRLKACKELLDSGVITQEEFETKKKQILEKY